MACLLEFLSMLYCILKINVGKPLDTKCIFGADSRDFAYLSCPSFPSLLKEVMPNERFVGVFENGLLHLHVLDVYVHVTYAVLDALRRRFLSLARGVNLEIG